MATKENDCDRHEDVQRLRGATCRQSTFAVAVSLAAHMLLLAVLYQCHLAYLADSTRTFWFVDDVPLKQDISDAEHLLEVDALSPKFAVVEQSSQVNLPAPAPSDLRRFEDAPSASTSSVATSSRREVTGALLARRPTPIAEPALEATELAVRSTAPDRRSYSAHSELRRATARAFVGGPRNSVPNSMSPESTSGRPRREMTLAEAFAGPVFATDAVPVTVEPSIGDGGALAAALEASLPDRLASRDTSAIRLTPIERASRHVEAAELSLGPVRSPSAAYTNRSRRLNHRSSGDQLNHPSTETDAVVERGLQYLASIQLADGHWEFQYLGEGASRRETERIAVRADAAATGLALLAFLGAGYDHFGDRYEQNVRAGLGYLTHIQSSSGELFPEHEMPTGQAARFYGHGIATLALGEAYGMTGDPQLRQPAEMAIDFLVATQHPRLGGWRYMPGTNTDLSVSGWQLAALRSGELAGLSVRAETYERLRTLVEQCREQGGDRTRFCYNPWASPSDPLTRHGRQPSTVMTSVGLAMLLYLNVPTSDEQWRMGTNHLLANLPQLDNAAGPAITGTLENPQRDTYYWYYATQVMHRRGGRHWTEWNERLQPLLVSSQIVDGPLAGSWDAHQPVPDKWADHGGRLYVTALNLLSLEVDNRELRLDESALPRIADRPKE